MQGYTFPGGNLHPVTDQCGDTTAWSPCLTWSKGVSLTLELSVGLAEAFVATALLLNFTLPISTSLPLTGDVCKNTPQNLCN